MIYNLEAHMNILMVDLFSPGNAYTEELVRAMKCNDMTVLCRTDSTDFGNGIKQIKKLYGGGYE